MAKHARESWGSRFGIVLAAAGSAVGLGNFLRFPGVAAQNGGGAFVIPYLLSFLFLALPLCWLEWAVGRFGGRWGQGSAPGVFDRLTARKRPMIKYFGVLGVAGALGIFFYYCVIECWTLAYTFFSATGRYAEASTPDHMRGFLSSFINGDGGFGFNSRATLYIAFLITFIVNFCVLIRGVSKGIERFCRLAMPMLFILAIVLVVRVFTLGAPLADHPDWNVSNALGFLWNPDFSVLASPKVWLAAAGQVFFSTSVGIGALMTYAAYVRSREDILLSSTSAAFLNVFAEIVLGASIVVPAAFLFFGPIGARDAVAGGTFGLAFTTTPLLFGHMPAGVLIGTVWFLLLFLAGVTSSISVVQPAMAFFQEEFGWTRRNSALVLGAISFCAAHLVIFGEGVLGEMDFLFSEFGLPCFALVEACICLRYLGPRRAWREVKCGARLKLPNICGVVMCYVSPALLAIIIAGWFVMDGWKKFAMGSIVDGEWTWLYPHEQLPWIFVTRILYVSVIVTFLFLVSRAWSLRKDKSYEM